MKEHFTFKKEICLTADGVELDLHNDYDFVSLNYSVELRVLVLKWRSDRAVSSSVDLPSEIEIEYRDVTRFEFRPRDPEMPFTEDDCLWSAGYWREAGWPKGVWSGCSESGVFFSDAAPENDWFRAFNFHSGAVLVVAAGEAHVKTRRAQN